MSCAQRSVSGGHTSGSVAIATSSGIFVGETWIVNTDLEYLENIFSKASTKKKRIFFVLNDICYICNHRLY